jgi:glutaredoxin-like protein NrdH
MSLVLDKIAEVKVITRPSCQPCKATIRKFGSYDLTIIDSAIEREEALALAAEVGYLAAPIVVVYAEDGTIIDHWTGFNPDRINAVVGAN